jgi:tripartite-type tricarboxylate transporter receptor subunit TctC
MSLSRRQILGAIGVSAGVTAILGAKFWRRPPISGACEELAGSRIRWVVPNAAGGGYDAETRLMEPYLERRLGAEILVDNQPGAGGVAGARVVANAIPDGRTLGTVGVPGLLVATLLGNANVPNPATDFTILGRIARSWHVWASGPGLSLKTIDEVIAASAARPVTFAISEAASPSLVSIAGAASLLGIPVEVVAGFSGTRSACLAAVRGDVDLVCFNFETIRDLIKAGDLLPLLQISATPISSDPLLAGVALLGGPAGRAVDHAHTRGLDTEQARAGADVLVHVMGSGRIVVGPPRMPSELADCLAGVVFETLSSPELRAVATRGLDVASARDARADVEAAAADAPRLVPTVGDATRMMRQQ